MVSRHNKKKRAQAKKDAAAVKASGGMKSSTTNVGSNLLSAQVQGVEQNSSPVHLDGGCCT